MMERVRSSIRATFALLLVVVLTACSSSSAGMNTFQSSDGRYAFLYPAGWSRVAVSNGPQVVFHDLINSDETLSLVVSQLDVSTADLTELGSPIEVGSRLMNEVIAPEGTGRNADLLSAEQRERSGHVYYDLEYILHLSDRERHELATVVLDRGYLYTLATSTNEIRWPKVKGIFEQVVKSFVFLI